MRPSVSYAILCDGVFPCNEIVVEKLLGCDVVVCCDGAAAEFLKYRKPEFVAGDMDSLSEEFRDLLSDRLFREEEQETNDLSKAFRLICALLDIERVAPEAVPDFSITIFGATGKREDHTLGNISHLSEYDEYLCAKGFPHHISMVTDFGTFFPFRRSCTFNLEPGRQISIFAMDPKLQISSSGLEYPTDGVVFDMWWKATLNKVREREVRLDLSFEAEVLIYIPSYFDNIF
ncbi:MAG: thiamine diphosphokinase [Bacteroidales bacterium]|nr:thiamine diphosphokinase [Bacteroidales bacterium]